MVPSENQIYAHYKWGTLYRVLRVIPHGSRSAPKESIVCYQPVGTKLFYWHFMSDFCSTVEVDGDTVQKYKLVG